MKKFNVAFIIILILNILFMSGCEKETEDYEKFFNSVFEITASRDNRFDSIGTAFKASNGKIYTNAHIVSYTKLQEKFTYDCIIAKIYKSGEQIELEIVNIDYEKDIAVLEPKNDMESFNKINGLVLSKVDFDKIGAEIFTIGNLNGYGLALGKGIIASHKKIINNNSTENFYIQSTIEISKGSSGGPVFNNQQECIGIMTFKLRDLNNEYVDGISFFIPASSVSQIN